MKILMLFVLVLSGASAAFLPAGARSSTQLAHVQSQAPPLPSPSPPASPQPRRESVWRWPLVGADGAPPHVERPFQPPARRWLRGHRGVDLTAPGATQVLAAGRGTVAFAGTLFGQGVVVISHGALRTSYEPVTPSVHVGDTVAAGATIGTLTASGHCPNVSCLHWGLLTGHGHGVRYYDPLLLLGLAHLRLEPVGASRAQPP